jgi:hypothetical protein
MASKGIINDRFSFKFIKDVSNNITELKNQVVAYENKTLVVESGKLKIKKIEIYDILGKQIFTKNNINNTKLLINEISKSNNLIIVKATLEDNSQEEIKVIY